eukprot:3018342-Lingulodinium_polyedra.AAC.1
MQFEVQVARPFADGAIGDCRRSATAMPDCCNNAQAAGASARQRVWMPACPTHQHCTINVHCY